MFSHFKVVHKPTPPWLVLLILAVILAATIYWVLT
jgi:hypothetical protein